MTPVNFAVDVPWTADPLPVVHTLPSWHPQLDAFHSLSIEGYQVTPELIQRVATGDWDPERQPSDRESANALAALCAARGTFRRGL